MASFALIGLALVVLALALLMPENRDNPDRLFGLTLTKSKSRPGARFARIVAAAKALVSKREESMFAFARRELEDPAFAAIEPAKVIGRAQTTVVEPSTVPQVAAAPEPKKTRVRRVSRNLSVVADPVKPTVARVDDASHDADPVLASAEPNDIADAAANDAPPRLDETAALAMPIAGEVAVEEAPAGDLEDVSAEAEQAPEPPIGREGRRIMWPRLIGLDSSALSITERLGVVKTLGAIAEPYVAPIMAEVLSQENDVAIRDAALEAIRDAQLDDALHAVEGCLTEPRDRERILAVEALARLGGGVEPLLFAALADDCVAVVMAAGNALRRREAITVDALRTEVAQGGDEQKADQVVEMLALLAAE